MPLSWNEIRSRAVTFSKEWAGESREQAEAKTFWDEFFHVFGLRRRHLASFEEPVKNLGGNYGFIDLFWAGVLLAEHKSRGKDLDKAHSQAINYIQDLQREDRGNEVPRYIIVSDFARLALHDLEEGVTVDFPLAEFHQYINHFGFIPGYKQHKLEAEDPINIQAVQIMGDLHDALEAGGYSGHELERLLVRILFCLFAEDTGIFERNTFQLYLENHTDADGSNLGPMLAQFFQVLNNPKEKRQSNLREELAELPYVNGELFAESLRFAAFDSDMRNRLVACTRFDWSRISPAIFGALFQAVMEPKERRQIGAHYTSERDILKVMGPLFLDELKEDLKKAGRDRRKLRALHDRMAKMRLLDPACGCGNFLVVSYRELRLLELEILMRLESKDEIQKKVYMDVSAIIDVDQMYGIEIEEWPVRIAEVAMWLMDHQMNMKLSESFGKLYRRLPLVKSPHIHHGNALRIDWNDVLPAAECTHVLGNPPFGGARFQTKEQRKEIDEVSGHIKNSGLLDYVTGWYFKAARYIQGTSISVAFVSTNSISQGEQVGVLWGELLERYNVSIHFAHRTFAWESEARGKAHVHVVIIGFGVEPAKQRLLFDYESIRGEPTVETVTNISPYLVEGSNDYVTNRSKPLRDIPEMTSGNKPIDDGNYLFTPEEKANFLTIEPDSEPYFRRWLGGREFIQGIERWCLYLANVSPSKLRSLPAVMKRVEAVRRFRASSKSEPTRKIADKPTEFHTKFVSTNNYLAMPQVSSERRRFIPIAFLNEEFLCGDKLRLVPNATLFHFGVLCSTMHMAWVRLVSGRLKSDFQYSIKLVYNNYPWPSDVSEAKRAAVERAAQSVLDARDEHPEASLADLYDPLAMPAKLTEAHAKLDRTVDRCYRSQPFPNERNRVEYLFNLYQELTTPLLPKTKKRRKK